MDDILLSSAETGCGSLMWPDSETLTHKLCHQHHVELEPEPEPELDSQVIHTRDFGATLPSESQYSLIYAHRLFVVERGVHSGGILIGK
jgi:hypothetical protein